MKWIYKKDKAIPKDKEVLIIWKGRVGILYIDTDENKIYCAICPSEFSQIMDMDELSFNRINYWMELPEVIFLCDQPERSKREDPYNFFESDIHKELMKKENEMIEKIKGCGALNSMET